MRRTFSLLVLIASIGLVSPNIANAQGIEFFHGSWEEALELANQEDKIIFVDAYTTWCGPCKRMAKLVFTDESVGQFYNRNFVCLKIDMEKEDGLAFQRKYPVSAYPTLYYIAGDGKVVHVTKGGRQAEQFIDLGKTAISKNDRSGDYTEAYEKGDRDPKLVYNYIKALNKAGKPTLKIANDYINSQKDLTTEHNLKFILEATTEADSRIFSLLTEYQAKIEAVTSKEAVRAKIERACEKTAHKAIEFQTESLLTEAKEKMTKHYPEKAANFSYVYDMLFYRSTGDVKNYLKTSDSYVKKEVKGNAKLLDIVAVEILKHFSEDTKAMKQAEKYAEKASKNGGEARYYHTYANILLKNGKKKEALSTAKKGLELAKGQSGLEMTIKRFIQQIES